MGKVRPDSRGFSLIELLLVLSILTVLMVAGSYYLGSRKGKAVQAVLDELEGTLVAAQKATVASGKDVALVASGNWVDRSLRLDPRPMVSTADPLSNDALDPTKRVGPDSEVFVSQYGSLPQHSYAGVASTATWYTSALGAATDLGATPMFSEEPYKSAFANRLFTGAPKKIIINGLTKRFQTGFSIVVVGLASAGVPVKDGPMGVIVVPADGTSVHRFYRLEGESTWKRQ